VPSRDAGRFRRREQTARQILQRTFDGSELCGWSRRDGLPVEQKSLYKPIWYAMITLRHITCSLYNEFKQPKKEQERGQRKLHRTIHLQGRF
jgi:hypothetical protein